MGCPSFELNWAMDCPSLKGVGHQVFPQFRIGWDIKLAPSFFGMNWASD